MRVVFAVLEAHDLSVDDALRVRIVGCMDLNQLDTWLRRAVSVSGVVELFDEPTDQEATLHRY